jgi:phenylacetate-CoA ligase
LTKKDIRQHREEIKCAHTPKHLFILGKTGGSTGEPMHYYYDRRGRDWNRGCVYRSQEWSDTYLGERSIQMTGSHYDDTEFKKKRWQFIFWIQRYKSLPVSSVNDAVLKGYYDELMRFRPTNIWGYASGIYCFARFIEHHFPQSDFSFLKAIITSSETLYDFQREKINQVFKGNKVFDHYGSREMYIASECREHKGYHIHSEATCLEIVDKDNRHKKAGDLGRVLVTDLSNKVFPFIRYEIGDVGVMSEEENCPCGITLPKLKKIEGRIADMVILPDRVLTPPNFTILLSDHEGIEQYQIIQKTRTELQVNIVKNGGFKEEYERYIKESLALLAGPGIRIGLNYVDEITTPLSGKRKYIISEVSQDYL